MLRAILQDFPPAVSLVGGAAALMFTDIVSRLFFTYARDRVGLVTLCSCFIQHEGVGCGKVVVHNCGTDRFPGSAKTVVTFCGALAFLQFKVLNMRLKTRVGRTSEIQTVLTPALRLCIYLPAGGEDVRCSFQPSSGGNPCALTLHRS